MIKYQLKCGTGCSFEGWFRSSDDFEKQAGEGALSCPFCGSVEVDRAIMAPAVVSAAPSSRRETAGREERLSLMRETIASAARRARDYVEKNFDYVGDRFPEEARRIHYGETDERQIYGEATKDEAKELIDEGVTIAPLPAAPAPPKKIN